MWSPRGRPWPRGHMLKSLALVSKVKSLALKPQVLKNCPVLGSRTALFLTLKILLENARNLAENLRRPFLYFSFGDRLKKKFEDIVVIFIYFGNRQKKFLKTFFFRLTLALVSLVLGLDHSCPWPRESMSSDELSLALPLIFFVSLASSLVSSTPPLPTTVPSPEPTK